MSFDPGALEILLAQAEALPAEGRSLARAIARSTLELHREGLARLVALLREAGPPGQALLRTAAGDELVGSLLALHDLVPLPADAPSTSRDFVPLSRLGRGGRTEPCERCQLCGQGLAERHPHLVRREDRVFVCACEACALLFDKQGAGYTRIRSTAEPLTPLSDAAWKALGAPVGLAFFWRRSATGVVIAAYPGAAGVVESAVDEGTWAAVIADHPLLGDLQPDVEALLVNRLAGRSAHYRVSIDQCYRLAGIVRSRWQGFSGGAAVEAAVDSFFGELEAAVAA